MFIRARKCNRRIYSLFYKFQKYSFGIYLVHAMIIEGLDKVMNLNALSFNPILSVPVISVLVIAISFVVVWAISKVPVVSKYII